MAVFNSLLEAVSARFPHTVQLASLDSLPLRPAPATRRPSPTDRVLHINLDHLPQEGLATDLLNRFEQTRQPFSLDEQGNLPRQRAVRAVVGSLKGYDFRPRNPFTQRLTEK